jgi:hypothetical protein
MWGRLVVQEADGIDREWIRLGFEQRLPEGGSEKEFGR